MDSDTQSYHVVGIGTCTDTDIVIPSSYNGLPVTGISGLAFRMCKNLTSVTIPDTVVSIGVDAFYGCENLTSIVIPDSVTFISSGTFAGCTRAFEIENGVSYIGKWVIDCDDSVGIRLARGLPQDRLPSVIHRLKRKIRIIIRSR